MTEQDVKKDSGFFAVSKDDFIQAWELGLNPALAYLIIAIGTGGDHATSAWSANAVSKYAGIDWKVADKAVKCLLDNGLMTNISKSKKPRYKLNLSEKPKMTWLPKMIIEDNERLSALKRLKKMRDPALTRMFVLLYSHQFMPEYGGVNHELLWRNYTIDITDGLEGMDWNCWSYETGEETTKKSFIYELIGERVDNELLPSRFWDRIGVLRNMGLLETVVYAIDDDGKIMFPLEGSQEHEGRVTKATFYYFEQLYIDNDMELRDDYPDFTTPHYQTDVTVKGVFRMRLGANTEVNTEFFRAMLAKVSSYCEALGVEFLE